MSLARWVSAASRLLCWVGGLALALMTLWTVTDVLTRYALAKPLKGSIDLVEATLVLVVFLALPECFQRDDQIVVDVVDHMAGERVVGWLKLVAAFLTMAFLLLLGITGIQPFLDALQFGDRKPDLPIPIALLLAAIEAAIALSVLVLVGKFVVQARAVLNRSGA